MKILIIEDTKSLALTLQDLISELGYMSDIISDGEEGLTFAESNIYDAIVLDIMLPSMNGFEILQTLRKKGIDTPVLILTAKCELEDRVHGLNIGADYYLTKPFNGDEFIACLHTILRRKYPIISNILRYGDLELNLGLSTICCGNNTLKLNSKELELMRLLILNTNAILSKEVLINKIWGFDSEATDNNVEAYVSFLRRKIQLIHSKVSIKIIRKAGYLLEYNND